MRIIKLLAGVLALSQNGTVVENNRTRISPFLEYRTTNPYVLYE